MVNGMERKPRQARQSAVIIFALCVLDLLPITYVEGAGDSGVSPSSFKTDTLEMVDNSPPWRSPANDRFRQWSWVVDLTSLLHRLLLENLFLDKQGIVLGVSI
jgi:hypothetical protein